MCIKILRSKFGYTSIQRSDQFVMSKSSVIMKFMDSRFKSPLHLETTPMSGWPYPEAQISTWMSNDTEIQTILLKKLIMNACRTRIKSNRLFNWKCQTITFQTMNGNGKTSLPMSSATDTSGNLRSRKLSVNWYDMKIAETEKQMEQFIGS